MGISRQEVEERCKAVYARVDTISEENAHEIAPLLTAAMDGCCNYILQNLNPLSTEEYPFLIVAMQNIIGVLKKDEPIAGLLASALSEVVGCRHVAIPDGSILEDAMRAMTGEGHHGREDK